MNTPNPLVPQGSLPDKGKAQIRITVFAILAIHVVLLGVLLIAGCNKKTEPEVAPENTGLPPVPPAMENWPEHPPALPPVTQDVTQLPPPVPPTIQETTTYTPPPVESTLTPGVPASTGYSEHTISKGESFYTIGRKYGVGYKSIADANAGMNPTRLKIGDKIKIPPASSSGSASAVAGSAPATTADGAKIYKVRSGDNLIKIARNHGLSLRELRAANSLRTDQIKVGQKLKIPVKEAASAPVLESIPPVPSAPPQ